MTALTIALVAVTWIAIGATLAVALGRHGHNAFSWFVLGLMLGPLAVPVAVYAWTREESTVEVVRAGSPSPRAAPDGRVDVLIGYDGSTAARAAIEAAVDLFGSRFGRLTLLTALPFDGGIDDERTARDALDAEADRLAWLDPAVELVHGRPGPAIVDHAATGGYDVIVIGTTGAGRARLFGSAARDISRDAKVPVLLAPADG